MTSRLVRYAQRFGWMKGAEIYFRSKVGPREIDVRLNHLAGSLTMRARTSDRRTFDKIFVNGEYEIQLPRPPQLIIDAGANVGYASVFFANRYPQARILAIEPDTDNFRLLQHNTRAYPNIRCMQCGIWSRNTNLRIENPQDEPWAFRVVETDVALGSIAAVTLERLMQQAGAQRIDVLKMDVEGAEREIFAAANCRLWLEKTDTLIAELHEQISPGTAAAMEKAIDGLHFKRAKLGENVILQRSVAASLP
jgi:FkbM family methyltransferase